MENNNMFNDIYSEELYDIDGGSTKVAAIVLIVATAVFGVGAYVANKTGHPAVSAGLTVLAGSTGLAAAWLAFAPSL